MLKERFVKALQETERLCIPIHRHPIGNDWVTIRIVDNIVEVNVRQMGANLIHVPNTESPMQFLCTTEGRG